MRLFFVALTITATGMSVGSADEPEELSATLDVALVQVLANPEDYVDRVITVAGFLNNRGTHLFLTKEHRALDDYASAIYVCTDCDNDDAPNSRHVRTGCENQYVSMTGLFSRGVHPLHSMKPSPYWMASIHRIVGARDVEQPYWVPKKTCWINPNVQLSVDRDER